MHHKVITMLRVVRDGKEKILICCENEWQSHSKHAITYNKRTFSSAIVTQAIFLILTK